MPALEEIKRFPWSTLDFLLVNEGEAESLLAALSSEAASGVTATEDTPGARAKNLLNLLTKLPPFSAIAGIVMTLGGSGLLARIKCSDHDDWEYLRVGPGEVTKVLDTTGAGDCFTGYLVAGLTTIFPRDPTVAEARHILEYASQAAAIGVERAGAMESIPSPSDVAARIKS